MTHSRHLADLHDTRCDYGGYSNDTGYLWVVLSMNLNGDPEMPVYQDLEGCRTLIHRELEYR